MSIIGDASFPLFQLAGIIIVIACGIGGAIALSDIPIDIKGMIRTRRNKLPGIVTHELDLAANLGIPARTWLTIRFGVVIGCVILGILSHIVILMFVSIIVGIVGVRFAVSGRAANKKLKMERAFLQQLRDLRDRMVVSNQSLDNALQELGRHPPKELAYILAPLARGGSVVSNIVEAGIRARSPVIEYACGVLIWSRTRSLDSLIAAIDDILLPVGEAQLAVQEESLITLTQQRAVTIAMSALMLVMFVMAIRVPVFSQFYQSFAGNVVIAIVLAIFASLVMILGIIVRLEGWTRWNLRKLAREQEKIGA